MDYNIKKSEASEIRTACLVVPVFSTSQLTPALKKLDQASKGRISALLKKR